MKCYKEWGTDGDMARSAGPSNSRIASVQPPLAKRKKTVVSVLHPLFVSNGKHTDREFQTRNDPPARDGVPSCKCGLDAAFATVAKEGPNKGRQFW